MLCLYVYAPRAQVLSEQRLPAELPAAELRARLERITGVPPSAQQLALFSANDVEGERQTGRAACIASERVAALESLAAWDAANGMLLRVDDMRRDAGLTEADVEKFELTDEQYAARRDTVRAYKEAHHLGRFAPEHSASTEVSELLPEMQPGARCAVNTGDNFERRGTIRYVGATQFAQGPWVGVEYDEPVGKNDGRCVEAETMLMAACKACGTLRQDRTTAASCAQRTSLWATLPRISPSLRSRSPRQPTRLTTYTLIQRHTWVSFTYCRDLASLAPRYRRSAAQSLRVR